jgi:hypothetical protein
MIKMAGEQARGKVGRWCLSQRGWSNGRMAKPRVGYQWRQADEWRQERSCSLRGIAAD